MFDTAVGYGSAERAGVMGRRLAASAIVLCLLLGGILCAASLAPFRMAAPVLARYTADGRLALSEAAFRYLASLVRLCSGGLLLVAAACAIWRKEIAARLDEAWAELGRSAGPFWAYFAEIGRGLDRSEIFILTGLSVVGLAARLAFLFRPMEWDEATTIVKFASRPLWVIASWYPEPNNHIFHTMLAHFAIAIAGEAPWAARLPALAAGVLVVPAGYIAARAFYGRSVALLTAAFLSVCPALVAYSTAARGYSIVTLLFLLLSVLAVYLKDHDNAFGWSMFSLVSAIGFYTMPVMLYPFVVLLGWMAMAALARDARVRGAVLFRRITRCGLATAVLALALYTPVLLVSGPRALFANEWVRAMAWPAFLAKAPQNLAQLWAEWNVDLPWAWIAAFAACAALAWLFHRRVAGYGVPLFAGAFLLAPLAVIQRVAPLSRTLIFLLPVYVMSGFAGAVWLARQTHRLLRRPGSVAANPAGRPDWRYGLAAVAIVVYLGHALLQSQILLGYRDEAKYTEEFRDAEQIGAFLKSELQPGDRLLGCCSTSPMWYQLHRYSLVPRVYTDLRRASRLIVMVNEQRPWSAASGARRTLASVLNAGVRGSRCIGPPSVLRRFRTATVYQIGLDGPACSTKSVEEAGGASAAAGTALNRQPRKTGRGCPKMGFRSRCG